MVRHLLLLCVGAQTFCREEAPPAAAGVCAPFPGKPYFSVERRKPFAGESARSQCEFAPQCRESLISPSMGANLSPGRAHGGCVSLRPIPGKALFLRRGAQTFHPGEPPAAVGVCASLPGKPYSSVERRKPSAGKSRRRRCEFAPRSRESLILPSRGANPSPGKAARSQCEFAPQCRESLISPSRGANLSPANPSPGNPPGAFSEGLRRKPRRRKRRTAGCIRR